MNKYIKGSLSRKTTPIFIQLKKIKPDLEPCLSWYDETRFLVCSFKNDFTKEQFFKIKQDFSINSDGYIIIECFKNVQNETTSKTNTK